MRRLPLTLALLAAAGAAQAVPYAPLDVRAAGMGGTGVASAKAGSAALFNPAMLSAQREGDKFQFVLGLGGLVADEGEMFDEVDAMQDSIDVFNDLADQINNVPPALNTFDQRVADLATEAGNIVGSLNAINKQLLTGEAGATLGVGVPNRKLGVGVFVSANAFLLGSPTIAATDISFLQDRIDEYADGQVNAGDVAAADADFPADSTVTGIAVSIAEYGVALSRRFELASGATLDAGVTPKAVSVSTFEYTAGVDNFDEDDIEDFETTDSGFGLDAGVVYRTSAESPWQFGLVAKNLVGSDYKTNPNIGAPRTIELATQVRAGAAYTTERATVAVDLDLTENDGLLPGAETQFLAIGAEYDMKYVQVRGGYRMNVAGSEVADVASLGLGLGPVDITGVFGSNTYGAFLNLGFGW